MTTDQQQRQQEAEANYFAICLLMPRHWVHTELDKMMAGCVTDDQVLVKQMATKFGVSETMMTMRLVELGRLTSPM